MLVDSHCHLDHFAADEIAAVVARARDAGVGRMVSIGVRVAQAATVKAIAERFPEVWGTVGVHPHNVAADAHSRDVGADAHSRDVGADAHSRDAGEVLLPSVQELVALADHPRIIGIGESGLDYFYDKAPREQQQESFRRHIRAARTTGLPLAIHARDADDDILAILREEREAGGNFDFLLHCFSSGRPLAERAVAMGGYVSFSGILTFPKSEALREIARDLPADRLLLETDSPYLAPVPVRGKRCEPAYVAHTAKLLATVRGVSVAAIEATTTANFLRLFSRAG